MKRPLAVIGFTYLAVVVVSFFLGLDKLAVFIAVFVCLAAVFLKLRKTRKNVIFPAVCITSAAALVWLMCFNAVYVRPTEELYGKTTVITGEICDLPYEHDGRTYYKIETSQIDLPGAVQHTKILLSSQKALRADMYDTVTATVNIYTQSEDSYKYYNISRGNYLTGNIDIYKEIKITENENKPLYYYPLCIRKYMLDTVNAQLPKEQAAFISAVLLADKSRLSDADTDAFRDSGISHIIVVSGFHLSVITQLMMLFLTFICMGRKRAAAFICAAFVFLYMAVVGFTPPILRAGVMQILFLFGRSITEKADSLNSLGLAALIICFINPYTAVDIGFLLSFSATLGIVLLGGKINSFVRNRIYPKEEIRTGAAYGFLLVVKTPLCGLISIISTSLSAMALSVPILLVYFKSFAPYTLITNILAGPAASLLIFTAMIMVFLRISVILTFLEMPFVAVSGLLTNYITGVAGYISSLPFSVIKLTNEYVPICIIASVILLVVFLSLYRGRRHILAALYAGCVILIFAAGFIAERIIKQGSIKLSIADCGEGLTVLMSDNENTSILFCGGSYDKSYNMENYLDDSIAGSVDYMLISGNAADTGGYARNILERYDINTVHVYDKEKLTESVYRLSGDCPGIICGSTDNDIIETVHIDNIDIHIYNTEKCCALYFELYGCDFLICSNDTDCSFLPEQWLDVDYLTVDGAAQNAQLVNAENIIISDTAENTEKAVDVYEENNVSNIYYTAGCGNLAVRVYNSGDVNIRREGYWLS